MEPTRADTRLTLVHDANAAGPVYRSMPANEAAEQALLGAILINNDALDRASEFLKSEHFFYPAHGRIFAACQRLREQHRVADPVTLRDYFERDGDLQGVGGAQYLAELAAGIVSVINAVDYARTIHDLFVRRQLIGIGEEVVNEAYRHDVEVEAADQIHEAEEKLYKLAEIGDFRGGFQPFHEVLSRAIDSASRALHRDTRLTGVTTGLIDMDRLLGGLQGSDLVILAGRPAMGKAQPLDAQILTATGWKAMGELRVGDRLASIDGAPSRVSGIFPQGVRQVYRVAFSDGRSTECCDEHLWRVHYRTWPAPRILPTAKLREMLQRRRYQGRLWIDLPSGHYGHDEPLPVEPWVLGALLGDGTLSGSSIRFSTAEPEMLECLAQRVGAEYALTAAGGYDYRVVQSAGHHRAGVQGVTPNALKDALAGLGLWNVRSEDKFVPPVYLTASRQARLDLLRGLMDTGGWVEAWGTLRISTSTPRLAQDVVRLVRSLGGTCTVQTKQPAYAHAGEQRIGRTAYVCNIQHPDRASLVLLTHKRVRVRAGPYRQTRLTFRSIEPTRAADTQCIAVTHPERLYITDDYILTHNTALATNIAFNAAKAHRESGGKEGAVVGFFSLEMSAEQLATRILSEEAEIPSEKIRKGEMKRNDFPRLVEAANLLREVPLFVDDSAGLSIMNLRNRALRLKRQHRLGLIVIDYLQLMRPSGASRTDNRVQEISEITRGLKMVAKDLNVPVLALSQLSRQVEQREDKRPQLSDLRESGSIEQDADVVMFVFREAYYVAKRQPREGTPEHAEWQAEMDRVLNLADVIVAKQRHGPTGVVNLHFEGMYTRFSNLDKLHDRDD